MLRLFLPFLLLVSLSLSGQAIVNKPFVVGKLSCQMGNNLFQIATTCAHAWDHDAEPYFPDLATQKDQGMPVNFKHVFFRCRSRKPPSPIVYEWNLPLTSNFVYQPIPYRPNMSISGTFQSEKFFAHHRQRLLDLFAPRTSDLSYIWRKYGAILQHPQTVGVQLRWFGCQQDSGWWDYLVQYGYDYLRQAVALFPKDTLFVVSSNNLDFARQSMPEDLENVIFLENEPHYIDFFVLSMCKHNIISNSTFGWWAAWLNRNPHKIVIAPQHWVDPKHHAFTPVIDVWPSTWHLIDAKWGKPQDDWSVLR
jgi:hypothetical protein